jgi:glucose-6-phosphate isomerase
MSFTHLKSYTELKELAKDPIDLTADGVLSSKRIDHFLAESLGLKLFFGTERVDDRVMKALFALAEETQALEKMEAMQSGKVMNFIEGFQSENRPVLHTAMRDFFDQRNASPTASEATELAYKEMEKLRDFLNKIEKQGRFTDIVQVGIGGSQLGPQAVYLALQAYQKPHRRAHFLSNVDPDDGARVFKQLDLSKTLVVIVSKSGGTLETLTNQEYVKEHFVRAGLDPKQHLVSVTGKGSPMDDPNHYLASFYMWDYIGGRYSVTSMVGGVMLAFTLGMDRFLDFLRGAHTMDRAALSSDVHKNLPLMAALLGIWNRNFLGHSTCAVIPYSEALSRFPAHLQQLDMESNGKRIDKKGEGVHFETGPIIWGEPGTNGQHSFFQLLHQGTTIVPMEIIGFCESQYREDVMYQKTSSQEKLLSNLLAQSIALAVGQKSDNPNKAFPGNRPNRILLATRLDPFTMGTLLAYYEHKVAFQGFIWDVNSFDQEGVQLGKTLALKFIDQFAALRQNKQADAKAFPLGYAYIRHLL